jgi:SHS family sialic acid transporter-like MFS transporter
MMQHANTATADSRGKWMALIAALLGWMFDGFEMGMFPLVGQNAILELLPTKTPVERTEWFGMIMAVFLIGAATGGVVFGWLGDRLGRVRAMALSIFTYAIFTGLCGFATQAWHIAVFRFIASLGMGGEWALGVALVTEMWPDRSRALMAGLIGAAANVGYLIVGLISLVLVKFLESFAKIMLSIGMSERLVDSLTRGDGWRLMMIVGALPALIMFLVMRLVPESHKWQAERDKGATSHWATRDLLGVLVGALGAGAVVMMWSPVFRSLLSMLVSGEGALGSIGLIVNVVRGILSVVGIAVALIGFMFPVVRYLTRAEEAGALDEGDRGRCIKRLIFGACLAGVALLGTWGSLQWAPKWSIALSHNLPKAKEYTQIAMAAGAIIGTLLAALLGGWIGRRVTYALLCIGSFVSLAYLYRANDEYGAKFLISAFAAGGITAAFYGWFPLYLPELFPTSIRATSQGFAFNFGRVISAVGTLQTATITSYFARGIAADRIDIDAVAKAAATLAAIYLVGIAIIWLGPETKGKPLPERLRDL